MGTLHFDSPDICTEPVEDLGGVTYEAGTMITVINNGPITAYVNNVSLIMLNPINGFPILPHSYIQIPIGDSPFPLAIGCPSTAVDYNDSQPAPFNAVWIAGTR